MKEERVLSKVDQVEKVDLGETEEWVVMVVMKVVMGVMEA